MRRVVITGLGALTPIGNSVKEFWNGLVAGKSGAAPITQFDASQYSVRFAAEVKGFQPEEHFERKTVRKIDRFVQFAIVASREALHDAALDLSTIDVTRAGIIVGAGIGGIRVIEAEHKVLMTKGPRRVSPLLIPKMIPNIAPGILAIELGFKGPNYAVITACATGAHALGEGFRTIQKGDADLMITGGTEAAITPLGVAGFANMKAISERNDEPERASRPFDAKRDGFVMGEGVGIIVLEALEYARRRGAPIYAEVVGYGTSADAYHITAPDPDGEGAMLCMKAALEDGGIALNEVDYINAHGTSTPLNDRIETVAIKRLFGDHAYKLKVSSNKSMIGHLLGAAGAAEAVATIMTIKEGIIPATINYEFPDPDCDLDYVPNQAQPQPVEVAISNSMGFGGHNCCLAFRRFKD